ncbi:MAG: hypothetical protein Q7T73_06805 [Beijerinckiaceae bacterium]|nr:hypothetical protein [Beijerinckiaceae bacterium]
MAIHPGIYQMTLEVGDEKLVVEASTLSALHHVMGHLANASDRSTLLPEECRSVEVFGKCFTMAFNNAHDTKTLKVDGERNGANVPRDWLPYSAA